MLIAASTDLTANDGRLCLACLRPFGHASIPFLIPTLPMMHRGAAACHPRAPSRALGCIPLARCIHPPLSSRLSFLFGDEIHLDTVSPRR